MTKQEKMQNVQDILNQIKEMIGDHLDLDDENELSALDLIKSATKQYETFMKDGE